MTEKPDVISHRRKNRDNLNITPESIDKFQNEEREYAEEVAALIGARFFICKSSKDLQNAIHLINKL